MALFVDGHAITEVTAERSEVAHSGFGVPDKRVGSSRVALELRISGHCSAVIDCPRLREGPAERAKIGHAGARRRAGNEGAARADVRAFAGNSNYLVKGVDVIGSAIRAAFERAQVGGRSIAENGGVRD